MPHTLSTLIIGYGNTLRGDDAAGFAAAELLAERLADPGIEILARHQLTPELMEPIARAAHVIFIDASVAGRPGKYHRIPLRPAPACSRFSHVTTPESLLAGAQSLYGHTPEATLYTIPGRSFETGEELTPAVRQAVDDLVATLETQLAKTPAASTVPG